MSLIWNNKEYKLVSDDSDWDKLEYVVSRKLHIEYTADQVKIELLDSCLLKTCSTQLNLFRISQLM